MKQTEISLFLDSLPLFGGTDDALLRNIVEKNGKIMDFPVGEEIYSPKNTKKTLGVMLSGNAYVFSADENSDVLLRTIEKGDTFGVATLFAGRDEFVSRIIAKKTCRVLFLSVDTIEALIQADETFRMNYIRFLSERICFLNTKISCFTAGSPERRLAFFLLSFEEGKPDSYAVSVNANSLSDMLNVGRASLYRAFEKLESENLICRKGKQITILDKNTLKRYLG